MAHNKFESKSFSILFYYAHKDTNGMNNTNSWCYTVPIFYNLNKRGSKNNNYNTTCGFNSSELQET